MIKAQTIQVVKQTRHSIDLMPRLSANRRGYTSQWREYARNYLKAHPLCVMCMDKGLTVASRCVDHIKSHKGNQELFWNPENHQALCFECHNRKTAQEDGAFGNKIKTKAIGVGV